MTRRRPRDIGTYAETAVTRVAEHHGFPYAERRGLRGALDAGDIALCPGAFLEVKGGDYARTASDGTIDGWLDVLGVKRDRLDANAFLITQRPHVGPMNAGRWWAWARLGWLAELGGGVRPRGSLYAMPVRTTLADALTLLRAAGYGSPLDETDVEPAHEDREP